MKLKQIDIQQYKSIQSTVKIPLDDENKFYAFIGKNGSGKTNVLQAIQHALQKRGYSDACKAEYVFELTDEECKAYGLFVDADRILRVGFNGKEPRVRRIEAESITLTFKAEKEQLQKAVEDLETYWKAYQSTLTALESDGWTEFFGDMDLYEIQDESKNTLTRVSEYQMRMLRQTIDRRLDDMKRAFEALFPDGNDVMVIDISFGRDIGMHDYGKVDFYQIGREGFQIRLHPIVYKAFGITNEKVEIVNRQIKEEIDKINHELEANYLKVKDCCKRFDDAYKKICKRIRAKKDEFWSQQSHLDETRGSLIEYIKSQCVRNVYYIDNENALLFGMKDGYSSYRQIDNNRYYNGENPIKRAMDTFLKERGCYRGEESLFNISKTKPERVKKWVDLINREFLQTRIRVPSFDKDEIQSFVLQLNGSSTELLVKEKNGETIPFNQTSLGRRWYLTYLFVKQLLKPGDVLCLDEPGAFLHPQAQEELRNDFKELSEKGVYVFVATHSEYMLPERLHNIYNVTMEEDGTHVQAFENGDKLCEEIQDSLGVKTVSDILFHFSKTLLLVEGNPDKECIEKFAKLLGYSLQDVHVHVCDGDSILHVAYICLKNRIKFKALLDNDNQYKSEKYQWYHPHYETVMETLKNNENCIFIGEGEKGALEDYFLEEKHRFHYFDSSKQTWKLSAKLVSQAKGKDEFHETTLQNFEQLFKKLGLKKIDK